jgi:hypothetical protein
MYMFWKLKEPYSVAEAHARCMFDEKCAIGKAFLLPQTIIS